MKSKMDIVQEAIEQDLPEDEIKNLVDNYNRENDDGVDYSEINMLVQVQCEHFRNEMNESYAEFSDEQLVELYCEVVNNG